jgi:hypothetical protein
MTILQSYKLWTLIISHNHFVIEVGKKIHKNEYIYIYIENESSLIIGERW